MNTKMLLSFFLWHSGLAMCADSIDVKEKKAKGEHALIVQNNTGSSIYVGMVTTVHSDAVRRYEAIVKEVASYEILSLNTSRLLTLEKVPAVAGVDRMLWVARTRDNFRAALRGDAPDLVTRLVVTDAIRSVYIDEDDESALHIIEL
jgi:hypothetical protein